MRIAAFWALLSVPESPMLPKYFLPLALNAASRPEAAAFVTTVARVAADVLRVVAGKTALEVVATLFPLPARHWE